MVIYINIKTSTGIKTISKFDQKHFKTPKEWQKAWYNNLCDALQEGHDAYHSKRATKEFRNNQK